MTSYAVISQMREAEAAPYAWIIDIDHTEEPTSEHNEMGTTGPSWATDEQVARLANDMSLGRRFRMLDDRGEVYYSGRLIDERDEKEVEWFGPLDDFGHPNAGAVTIEYQENGEWVKV
jgi:hypothetical protein